MMEQTTIHFCICWVILCRCCPLLIFLDIIVFKNIFPGKSQVAIGFVGKPGTDLPREAIRPLGSKGSNSFSGEIRTAPCEIR